MRRALRDYELEPRYFCLEGPHDWGDCGDILIAGDYDRDKNGQLLVYRTGPFAPPIAIAYGRMVVTERFRRILEASGLTGLTFHPAVKHHIVEFHWEHWDRKGEMGDLPPINEPEDLVHEFPHSQETARAMELLWEARAEQLVELESFNKRQPWDYDLRIAGSPRAVRNMDFFLPTTRKYPARWIMLVSAKAKKWLEEQVPDWVSFKPLYVKARRRLT